MRRGHDIAINFPDLYLVHHNLPGRKEMAHSHDEHQLLIPLSGEITVETASGAWTVGPGRMVYLPPRAEHAFQSAVTQGERLIALIKESAWTAAGGPAAVVTALPAHQLVKELLFYLLLSPATKHANTLLKTLIHTVGEVLETAPVHGGHFAHREGRAQDHRVKAALLQLQKSLDAPISMAELARRSGLSVRSLNRLFLTEVGLTPKQAHARARIEHATELLCSSGMSVTEVALAVGYQSLSQFIAMYRRVTGQLPSDVMRRGTAGRGKTRV